VSVKVVAAINSMNKQGHYARIYLYIDTRTKCGLSNSRAGLPPLWTTAFFTAHPACWL